MNHVLLIPGFFGFAHVGDLRYWAHVRTLLARALESRGVEARIHEVTTRPTASIVRRAAAVVDTAPEDGVLHLVGHSTGGLDARVVATVDVQLPSRTSVKTVSPRVRTVVGVSAPNRGAPLARYFEDRGGSWLLETLMAFSLHAVRLGPLPRPVIERVAGLFGSRRRLSDGLAQQVTHDVLADWGPERRAELAAFLEEVRSDVSLLVQLRPEAVDLLGATCPNAAHVAYASVVTAARDPGLAAVLEARDRVAQQASRMLYSQIHPIARWPEGTSFPMPPDAPDAFRDPAANDGIVPTSSQPWGEVLAYARADHLDILGHFDQPELDPPHLDWLFTGSGFRRPAFEEVWGKVADHIAAHAA